MRCYIDCIYMRKFLIAANWKMNPVPAGAFDAGSPYHPRGDVDVVIFPTMLDLKDALRAKLLCGPQYAHSEASGPHTGDVGMKMAADAGCRYVLCGHSDRRAEHHETDEHVAAQVIAALECGLHPIVCIGETLPERKDKKQHAVVKRQLKALPLESAITIAYEPVWAISRGDPTTPSATAEDAEEMHAFIRSLLPEDRKEVTRILYGGSMKPDNAEELLKEPDIDGGLVGGASLKPEQFGAIVDTAATLRSL